MHCDTQRCTTSGLGAGTAYANRDGTPADFASREGKVLVPVFTCRPLASVSVQPTVLLVEPPAPAMVVAGTAISIFGTGFGDDPDAIAVSVGSQKCEHLEVSGRGGVGRMDWD